MITAVKVQKVGIFQVQHVKSQVGTIGSFSCFSTTFAASFCYHWNGKNQINTIYQFFTFRLLLQFRRYRWKATLNFWIQMGAEINLTHISLRKGKSILRLIEYCNIHTGGLQVRIRIQK